MDIFQVPRLSPVRVIQTPNSGLITKQYLADGVPTILDGFAKQWPCADKWSLEYIGSRAGEVRAFRPSSDGIYRFGSFERMPFHEFAETLNTTKDVYLGLDPIYRSNEKPYVQESLKELASDLVVPDFVPEKDLRSVNLWIGPGGNKTLLHFDPWNGLLILIKGRKRFALFPPTETHNMATYSVFDLKSTFENHILDSRIDPLDIDETHRSRLSEAVGHGCWLEEGQALFIPAGYWHYVTSEGTNVAVNFFWEKAGWRNQLRRPLVDRHIKVGYRTAIQTVTRFLRTYIIPKRGRSAKEAEKSRTTD